MQEYIPKYDLKARRTKFIVEVHFLFITPMNLRRISITSRLSHNLSKVYVVKQQKIYPTKNQKKIIMFLF